MPGYTHPKWYCQFIENFHVYLQQTDQLYSHAFLKIDCLLYKPEPELKIQNFAKYGTGGEISTTILGFILDYFQENPFK